MTRPRAGRRDGRRAVAALEFALLAPVLLFVAAGVVETGLILGAYQSVNRLAMQYAISYADCADTTIGACQAELAQYAAPSSIANVAPQLLTGAVTLQMAQVRMNGSSPTVVYSYPRGLTLSAVQIAAARAAVAANQSGIVVTVSYAYTMMFFQDLMATFYGAAATLGHTVAQLKS